MRISPALFATVLFAAPIDAQTPLTTVRVATGLDRPVGLTSPPDDHRRLYVIEQGGRVRIIKDGQLLATPFLDISNKVSIDVERGLLGLAFHPAHASNGFFYVDYTDSSGAVCVARYRTSSNPDRADPSSAMHVLGPIAQPFPNHNGGCLQFGPDGYLYISVGDGGARDDPACNAQNGQSMLGKLLRIDVDGGTPYAIPPGNPFVGNPSHYDEIWALGLRNPWRFSFDRDTGDLYLGDVGQNRREEIDFQPWWSGGGENYGWKVMEAELCHLTAACNASVPGCNDGRLTHPIYSYATGPNCSITGGYVYRGCAIPDLRGAYFHADYCSARIWSFRYSGQISEVRDRTLELRPGAATIDTISSFGEDADGELYVVDHGGEIFKIVAAGPPVFVDLGFGKIGGNGQVPALDVCGRLGRGEHAELRLRDAPPSTAAVLLIGLQFNPQPSFGGTLVPVPPMLAVGMATDTAGRLSLAIDGDLGPGLLLGQYLLLDPQAAQGMGMSNAIWILFP